LVDVGYHKLFVRTKDENGKWSLVYNQDVYKAAEPTYLDPLPDLVQMEYYFDTDPGFGNGEQVTISSDSIVDVSFNANLSSLGLGDHNLFVRTKDENGKWSLTYTYEFNLEMLANFTVSDTLITEGEEVHFTDLSTGNPTIWKWDFENDGVIDSITQNPSWNYDTAGVYSVKLIVSDGTNYDTLIKQDYIIVCDPNVDIFPDSMSYCNVDSSLIDAGGGFNSYSWNTGDTTQSIYVCQSSLYSVTVTDTNGCTPSDTVYLSIVNATIEPQDTTICIGDTISLSALGNSPSCNSNYSLYFDGTNDYVEVNNNLGTPAQLSGCCWVKFPQSLVEDDFPILANWSQGSGIFILHYGYDQGVHVMAINLWLINGNLNFSLDSSDYNTWMFVSFTYDGTTLKIYKNGILKDEKVVSGPLPSGSSITTFGTEENYGFTYCFEGNIDEVSLWNTSLSQEEIQIMMCNGLIGSESGLMGYWKFNEGSGSLTYDTSQYQNNGIIHGATWSEIVPEPYCITYLWSTGDTTYSIIVSPTQTTIYWVQVTDGITTCTDSITITVYDNPTAFAGLDDTICVNVNCNLSGSATGYDSLAWTTSGDGVFNSPASATGTYSPGSNDIINGTVLLTLTAYSLNPCTTNVSDYMALSIVLQPVADAGQDDEICFDSTYALLGTASNQDSVLWITQGDGTFSDAYILNPIYTPGSSDMSNGSVLLSLTAFAQLPCTYDSTDNMTLILNNSSFVPENTAVSGLVLTNGTICFEAKNTITVAGNQSIVWIKSGSEASFIAGEKVVFSPGFEADTGSIVHASITTACHFCSNQESIVANPILVEEIDTIPNYLNYDAPILIYPNPTSGLLAIDLPETLIYENYRIEVYDYLGRLVKKKNIHDRKEYIDLSMNQNGMYFIIIRNTDSIFRIKVIKM